jgi:hypothetical protein
MSIIKMMESGRGGGEMGGACNTHGRVKIPTKFWSENVKGGDHSEDLYVYGEIILEWIF